VLRFRVEFSTNTEELSFEHLEKPKDLESSRILVQKIVHTTAEGCIIREQKIKQFFNSLGIQHTDEDRLMMMQNYSATIKLGTISVISAVAGSFPASNRSVSGVADTICLFSHAIDQCKHTPIELSKLADQIFQIMGEKALKISGGIDYSDPQIKNLLSLEEIQFSEDDTNTKDTSYQSFSERGLIQLLLLAEAESDYNS